ncbi:hypothetical protein GI582_24490 [Sulfitobacter sp. BDSS02]|uniref:hypothetical protein n=1 Tax=Heliomarina sp. TaxID=2917556 RepID=UPI004058A03D|nr:hypothetical protein [Sulfitobacter sp. BDSS02]MBR9852416.1 hypothetical protein [Paracoccaceae bacterium]
MSLTTTGPCGLTLPALIAQADIFARTMATFGLTGAEQMDFFCSCLGKKLTGEYLRLRVAQHLPPYDVRLKGIVEPVFDALDDARPWETCAVLGSYDGPPFEPERGRRLIEMAILGFEAIRHHLGVSDSELLDLLAWKQTVLTVRLLVEQQREEKGVAR